MPESLIPLYGGQAAAAGSPSLASLRAVRRVAAPSWVLPGSLADNCRFLAGRVDEAGLLFFETESSLAYGEADLPPDLALLPLAYHVHLPLDLPWSEPDRVADICLALMQSCARLCAPRFAERLAGGAAGRVAGMAAGPAADGGSRPIRGVLHPPGPEHGGARAFAAFLARYGHRGGDSSLLLLENTPENDLAGMVGPAGEANMGFCLDLGHLLACGQERALLRAPVLERTRMLHLSAPGLESGRIRHLPLTALDEQGRETGRRLCREAPADAVLMIELFAWEGVVESLPVLCSWLLPGD